MPCDRIGPASHRAARWDTLRRMSAPLPSSKPGTSGAVTDEPLWGTRVGWLVGAESAGRPLVDFDGNRAGALVARTAVPLAPELLQGSGGHRVVLVFENGDPRQPIIIGLVQATSATPMLDALLEGDTAPAPEAEPAQAEPAQAKPVEAHVDGKRVVIEGADEVVLKCGQASITLRRNGKLIIKGTYVETHATGVNRIKGGSVQVN
jgi:hypothetical protein